MERKSADADPSLGRSDRAGEQELTDVLGAEVGIQCAKDEGKPIRGIWAYKDDRTNISGVPTYTWSDENISNFIDSL